MPYNAYNTYPYAMYPATSYASYAQQQPAQYGQQPGNSYAGVQAQAGIVWVDGEVGAKAYQLPTGWPANTPMPLWDTNDTIIYLKSTNPMGMPNPLQKIHYRMDEQSEQSGAGPYRPAAPALMSGDQVGRSGHDEQYVTKDDFEQMKRELRESITSAMKNGQTQESAAKKGGRSNESAV